MTLDGALSIATGGLANVNRQMAVMSQNVANAGTPGYAAQIATQYNVTADGEGMGVHTGPTIRNLDAVLQAELFSQNATVAGLRTRHTALAAIDAVQGTPGAGSDIASQLGQLQDAFSTLLNSPDSAPQQSAVVIAAATLARGINTLSDAYVTQRQTAQDNIVGGIAKLNQTLATIGGLSDQIVALKSAAHGVADLENQRDAALAELSQLVDLKVMQQPNGDVLLATTAGLILPTHRGNAPFVTSGVNVQPAAYYPNGGIGGVFLGGADVTGQLRGGELGANITLRDVTLPTEQAELDEFAQNLAERFALQGLALFTDPTGTVPASGGVPTQSSYVGFSGIIQVNAAVQANPATVRDGTTLPSTGLAGYTGIIQNVLSYTFGPEQAPGIANPVSHTAGLGPSGTLTAPYVAPPTLGGIVATLLAAQAQESGAVTTQADIELAVQSKLAGKLSAQSGVNMDTEMSHMIVLQNAYNANARVIAAVQAMWSQLLAVVR